LPAWQRLSVPSFLIWEWSFRADEREMMMMLGFSGK
jgi:hypothetical protein